MKSRWKIITIIITYLILIIMCSTNTFAALTELQEKATDLNHDGKRDIRDLDLIVSQPFPDRVKDGVEPHEGANVNYIFRNNTRRVSSSEIIEMTMEYIHSFEGTTHVSEDGTQYQINGDLGVGHGVDIDDGGYTARFLQAGYSITAGSWVSKEFVDAIERETVEDKFQKVQDLTSGLNLTDYQLMALVSRAYNCGEAGAITYTGSEGKTFNEAFSAYWNDSKNKLYYGQSTNENVFNEKLYTTYMNSPVTGKDLNGGGAVVYYEGLAIRRKSEWLLFATGYCDRLEIQLSSTSSSSQALGSSSIAETAINIHQHLEKNNYAYACVHNTNAGYTNKCNCDGTSHFYKTLSSSSVKEWYDIRCMDCSAYVSWVLLESGIDIGRQASGYFYNGSYSGNSKYKWSKITNWNQLQPGDILVNSGHVGIYIGNNKSLGAGSTNLIRRNYECNTLDGIDSMYEFAVRVNK